MREVSCFSAGKREAMSMARNRRWNHELKLFVATLSHSTCKKVVVVGEMEILFLRCATPRREGAAWPTLRCTS